MSVASENKPEKKSRRAREARLTIDCSIAQKRKIKILAASKDMSVADFMLCLVEEKYISCPLEHTPNTETIDSIEASERGEGLHRFDSAEEMFKSLGL